MKTHLLSRSPQTVAERLNEYGQALHTTEFLFAPAPYIARGAARDSLSGLKEVMELLQGTDSRASVGIGE